MSDDRIFSRILKDLLCQLTKEYSEHLLQNPFQKRLRLLFRETELRDSRNLGVFSRFLSTEEFDEIVNQTLNSFIENVKPNSWVLLAVATPSDLIELMTLFAIGPLLSAKPK